ncbi:hypothetical protein L1987_06038 [Smallanthus sonchifolius]|uniref:Uncharacterized protein n=1 Tax=Smallanthus sonchifolius TaxID=185202 RepID=A0ACB9JX70_9ASTR|nr:hypothetical protein L1987_06038 [Smallanthus sonchifolius]
MSCTLEGMILSALKQQLELYVERAHDADLGLQKVALESMRIIIAYTNSILQKWAEIIGHALGNVTNTSAAGALATYFLPQITLIFLDISVKRETLKLIETFMDKAEDQPQIGKQFVPPMVDPVLGDYARNLPDARESEVLSLFATIINNSLENLITQLNSKKQDTLEKCELEQISLPTVADPMDIDSASGPVYDFDQLNSSLKHNMSSHLWLILHLNLVILERPLLNWVELWIVV